MKRFIQIAPALLAVVVAISFAAPAFALPALQLGPGAVGDWVYDTNTQTWVTSTNPFQLNAYANDTGANGGDGGFAWDAAGAGTKYAYLVVSAIPMVNFDSFDVTVNNDGGSLSIFGEGYGAAPLQDPNSLAPHGVFDTYFKIYQFQFDGAQTDIENTQPPGGGTAKGFVESFDITINSLTDPVRGIHMDLFTVAGDGTFDPNATGTDRNLVKTFAPFSHDAQNNLIPEPGSMLLLGLALAGAGGLGFVRRRRRS